jgi:hypothetical protein
MRTFELVAFRAFRATAVCLIVALFIEMKPELFAGLIQ